MNKETWLCAGLIVLMVIAVGICTYQLFFNKVEAAMFRCAENYTCNTQNEDCSGSITCECTDFNTGLGNYRCQFDPTPNQ